MSVIETHFVKICVLGSLHKSDKFYIQSNRVIDESVSIEYHCIGIL